MPNEADAKKILSASHPILSYPGIHAGGHTGTSSYRVVEDYSAGPEI